MKRKKGFTLVELIVILAILGCLASLAIPAYQKYHNASIKEICQSGCLYAEEIINAACRLDKTRQGDLSDKLAKLNDWDLIKETLNKSGYTLETTCPLNGKLFLKEGIDSWNVFCEIHDRKN